MNPADVTREDARAAGPWPLCAVVGAGHCKATDDGYCGGGYAVDGDDWLRCHGE